MCSIIAYKGKNKAAPIIVDALKKMEYRGYDSVGVATISRKKILLKKGVGKVEEVNKELKLEALNGNVGIGHTRWATHGGITDYNAHPHHSCNKDIAIVHNGKIDNYEELKNLLINKGHEFKSETDSEVIAHLIEEHLKNDNIINSIIKSCNMLEGAYAFVAVFNAGTIISARRDEPLIIGIGNDEYYISSDVLGFIKYTDQAIFLDNNEFAIIDKNLKIYNNEGREIHKNKVQIAWEFANVDKGKYAHYTLKEINEQSYTIARVLNAKYDLNEIKDAIINKKVILVASGSSYNASLIGKMLLSQVAINCEVLIASECQYYKDVFSSNAVLLALSQSGETKDVLRAVSFAKENNMKVLSLVNVKTSSLARESDLSLSIDCGPEIGVAATKSFTAQVAFFYKLANYISNKFIINVDEINNAVSSLLSIGIDEIVEQLKYVSDIYILARGLHYPIALEGALKIKELAYIHAEAMPAGEFRHGPLALVDNNTVVIIINPCDNTYNDTSSNIKEVKARGGRVLGISNVVSKEYDWFIKIPSVNSIVYPLIEVIPLQLLAYNLALKRDYNPDYPRNLAKSVTVD
ncbi:MAG: glutamine--fructose-6-phosphate transaminase (isomerizing) [Candidatus Nitrosocaldaceae archaeon]